MDMRTDPELYGSLDSHATLTIQRLLPGPIERVWRHLTDGGLRRRWLAAGELPDDAGGTFELVWRNDELTEPAGRRPEGFAEEQRMRSRLLACEAPRRLAFTWGDGGDVTFTLEPRGDRVLLTVTHRGLADRNVTLMVGAGWHMHLDILSATLEGRRPEPFWDGWTRLRAEYDARLAA